MCPGACIALAHSTGDLWLEATIKETERAGVRTAAGSEMRLDAAHEACSGVVERIGDAATSKFALIPNANPTVVFNKITQRVAVRIAIGADCIGARPGAMATLKIPHAMSVTRRWALIGIIALGAIGTMMAATIVNVALPSIIGAFGLGQDEAQWLSTAFLTSSTGFMLLNT